VPAAIRLDDGQRTRGKLQTISVTGGLLLLGQPLSEGDFVEIAFQTRSGPVQGMAEMLTPLNKFTKGCLQPFRFIALGDDDHRKLRMALDSVVDQGFLGARSSQFSALKGL
jgi:hypothetical protein